MKIQCNVCEIAEAKVLCCADEAALCWSCDEKVHAANKLATKHQRVSLSSSPMPKCDICQEAVGYFFCLEDRALLCRKCDVAIHTVNAHVSAHRRFLLTGVKVGLQIQSTEQQGASGNSNEKIFSQTESTSLFRKGTPMSSLAGQYNKVLPLQVGDFSAASYKLPFAGGSAAAGSIPQWHLDDFGLTEEFNQTFGYMDNGSSKADSGKLGDSDCFPNLRAGEELDADDECLGQVPEASWTVPQIHSPPTASGLYWPKPYRPVSDAEVFVPDICCSPMQNPTHYQPTGTGSKRRRGF